MTCTGTTARSTLRCAHAGRPREHGTMNDSNHCVRRRFFLKHSAGIAAASMLPAARTASANVAQPRDLAMVHTHTHERIELVYAVADAYVPDALGSLNRFLRDHYTGDVGR